MEEFIQELGIQGKLNKVNGKGIIDIQDSNEYGRIYSRLDRSELLEEDEDSSQITLDNATIVYEGDDYQLTLLADFNADQYKLVIKEKR